MNSKKLYISLSSVSLILSIMVCCIPHFFISNQSIDMYVSLSSFSIFLIIINIVLVIIFTILLIKKELNKTNILFPIIYIIFTAIVIVICILFNDRLVIPNIQFPYYIIVPSPRQPDFFIFFIFFIVFILTFFIFFFFLFINLFII